MYLYIYLYLLFGVGIFIAYSVVYYLIVSFSEYITSVGEGKVYFPAIDYS